jgi:hypothetical protein
MAYTTIDDPEAYFQVKLYTGSGSIQSITLDGDTDMQPDFIWCRSRGETRHHYLADSVRGVKSRLRSDATNAEYTANSTSGFDSFDSDGFTLEEDSSSLGLNESSHNMVAWCWKANGSGSANTDGSISTTATSANTTAGFSINQWDGSDADGTLGHGLNVAPRCILIKNQDAAEQWYVYHESMGNGNRMVLNDTSAPSSAADWWQDTSPTTSVIYLSGVDGINGNNDMINYCWHEVQGFSKFGTVESNGNVDGSFCWLGFRAAFIMIKSVDSTSSWQIFDNKREGYNVDNDALVAEANTAEVTTDYIDILSNGFKVRSTSDPGVAETYIYMAFAEAPFVNSNGVPCNAR